MQLFITFNLKASCLDKKFQICLHFVIGAQLLKLIWGFYSFELGTSKTINFSELSIETTSIFILHSNSWAIRNQRRTIAERLPSTIQRFFLLFRCSLSQAHSNLCELKAFFNAMRRPDLHETVSVASLLPRTVATRLIVNIQNGNSRKFPTWFPQQDVSIVALRFKFLFRIHKLMYSDLFGACLPSVSMNNKTNSFEALRRELLTNATVWPCWAKSKNVVRCKIDPQ